MTKPIPEEMEEDVAEAINRMLERFYAIELYYGCDVGGVKAEFLRNDGKYFKIMIMQQETPDASKK